MELLQNEFLEMMIKAIARQVIDDLRAEMPKDNSWKWEYAFENVERKYGLKEVEE